MLIFKFILMLLIVACAFEKQIIYLGKHRLTVEVAETEAEHERGLMFRKSLPNNSGMLFIFKDEVLQSFWMKDTLIPLSIGYFSKEKILNEIIDMDPASPMDKNPKIYSSSRPAKYALEVPQGWFRKNKIKVGEKLKINSGLKSERPRQPERTGPQKQYKGL